MLNPGVKKSWWLAIRPPTLLTGFSPVLIGTSIALNKLEITFNEMGFQLWGLLFLTLVIVALLQGGANLVNDVKDFEKGVDNKPRLGPMRATQMGWLSPKKVKRAYCSMFALAMFLGLMICLKGGVSLLILGLSCVAAAYFYSGGPFPLSHLGLGELLALVFFGPVAVAGTAYIISGHWDVRTLLYGLSPGLLAAAMMAVNNIRDLQNDEKAGKKTLAVALGEEEALRIPGRLIWLSFSILVVYGLIYQNIALCLLVFVPLAILIRAAILPLVLPVPKALNQVLKRISVLNLLYGLIFFTWSL